MVVITHNRLFNYFRLKSKLHDEQLDREGSIISYVSLVKTIETGIVLLLEMALHSLLLMIFFLESTLSQHMLHNAF